VDDVAAVAEGLQDPAVAGLLRALRDDHLDDDTLVTLSGEHGLELDVVRSLVVAALEPLSTTLSTVGGLHYWYYPTTRIRTALQTLDARCTAESGLARALAEEPGLAVRMNILNAIHSCRLDGIEIDFDSAHDLLLLERSPRTVPERIVVNSFALFREVAAYAERELDVDMVVDLYRRLSDGLGETDRWLDRAADHPMRLNALSFATPREVLEVVCQIARDCAQDPSVHRALLGLDVHANLLVARPFPRLNGTMARLIMHIQSVRHGYPVLGIEPFSMMYARWEADQLDPAAAVLREAVVHAEEYTPNITGWVTLWLHLAVAALHELEAELAGAVRRRAAQRALLALDPDLNERQREILGAIEAQPSAELRIMAHKTAHDIAYSTARADFLHLEAKGYVVRDRVGHASVYRAAPELQAMLARVRD